MTATSEVEQPHLPGVLVDLEWLHSHLAHERLVIVDARSREKYLSGHIEGAVNLEAHALLDPDPMNSRNMAPIPNVEKTLGEAGIDMQRAVVVYDNGTGYRAASRVYWVMEVHGHPAVAVLNGGYTEWSEKELPRSTEPVAPPVRRFVANMRPERLATKLSVMRATTKPNVVIVDSRSDDEYRGLKSKANRAGHIISAVNVDYQNNLVVTNDGVCNVAFSDELLRRYRLAFAGSGKIITYCNSGNRASVSYLALRALGYDVAVYDGSWLEWGNDPTLPIETTVSSRN